MLNQSRTLYLGAAYQFAFSQKDIQDEGGWCEGICSLLCKHIVVWFSSRQIAKEVWSATAFGVVQEWCWNLREAKKNTNSMTEKIKIESRRLLNTVQDEQYRLTGFRNPLDYPDAGVNQNQATKKKVTAAKETAFDNCGIALTRLFVTTSVNWSHGCLWQHWNIILYASNHAGVVVWDSVQVFVFDPNTGGILVNRCWWPNNTSIPYIVDECSQYMYSKNDRQKGNRRPYIREAVGFR